MKTIDELYQEIVASDELKAELAAAAKQGTDGLLAFINGHGVELTKEQLEQELEERANADQTELSDGELELVAGGDFWESVVRVTTSILTIGLMCARG